jgi:small-conductance mechanosensitive channel
MESWMKSQHRLVTLGLLILILAAVVALVLTRDSAQPDSASNSRGGTHKPRLVDEQPLQTARAVSKLASSRDEQRFAEQALRLGDNEVDLTFEDALRSAADHPVPATEETKALYTHASQAEADVEADQTGINLLKKQLAAATGAHQDDLQQRLDVAQAQIELDQDELADAKEDLARSGADPLSRIQRQLKRHDDSEHAKDASQSPAGTAPVAQANYQGGNLLAEFLAWHALRGRTAQLQQARDEAAAATVALNRAHDQLDKQVDTEKAAKQAIKVQAANRSAPTADAGTGDSAQSDSATVKSLHLLSDDQKNLADLDKRIQDEQELESSYASWIALVQSHQRAELHGMIQSLLWILLIFLAVYIVDQAVNYYLADKGEERTRLHTLRVVIRSAVQALGVLAVALAVFGAPSQMPTILGLAGAGLTVALKDFIVAFFGWFVLMGKNGLRVGDWVEINGVAGEVVEINLLRTVLLETGNWTDTGHPTGRKVAFVNSYAIEGHFFNFTTSGQWLWDELEITVPANQDPYPLLDAIQKTVAEETASSAHDAEEEWQNATTSYKVRSVSAKPTVNLRPTAAGVEVHVRYIARAQERSAIRAHLNQALVELLHHRGTDKKEGVSAAK